MKKMLFLSIISYILVSDNISYSQNDSVTVKISLIENDFVDVWNKIRYQQQLAGYFADSNLKFNSILKLIFTKKLNIDSLLLNQPQLSVITVNNGLVRSAHYMNAILFIKTLNFNTYLDTNLYTIEYECFEIRPGDIQEVFRIYKDNKRIRRITFEYETQSNLIRLIRDAHMN